MKMPDGRTLRTDHLLPALMPRKLASFLLSRLAVYPGSRLLLCCNNNM